MVREVTRERILRAAAELFAERGYIGTTTSAIAAAAGVNEVTVFRHFESKAGIVRAIGSGLDVSEHEYPPREVIVEGDVRATLRGLAALEIASAVTSGALVLRLSFDARTVPELREAMGAVSSSNVQRLTDWLQDEQARGELRPDLPAPLLAEAFFSLTSTLVMSRMAIGVPGPDDAEIEQMAERNTRLLWSGIGPRD